MSGGARGNGGSPGRGGGGGRPLGRGDGVQGVGRVTAPTLLAGDGLPPGRKV